MMARARCCSVAFIRSRNGVPTSTRRPCSRASSSVVSLSSGCWVRTELIFSRRRAFLLLNSSFALSSGVSDNPSVVPATLSAAAKDSGGGCNSELGFCGMSGKSGGRVGGLTGGGSGSRLSARGLFVVEAVNQGTYFRFWCCSRKVRICEEHWEKTDVLSNCIAAVRSGRGSTWVVAHDVRRSPDQDCE